MRFAHSDLVLVFGGNSLCRPRVGRNSCEVRSSLNWLFTAAILKWSHVVAQWPFLLWTSVRHRGHIKLTNLDLQEPKATYRRRYGNTTHNHGLKICPHEFDLCDCAHLLTLKCECCCITSVHHMLTVYWYWYCLVFVSSGPLKERNQPCWLPSFLLASYLPTRWTVPTGHSFTVWEVNCTVITHPTNKLLNRKRSAFYQFELHYVLLWNNFL